ncbi:hypothetical protein D3C84_926940 [compost metagenome]
MQHQANAVFEGTAVLITPLITQRRKKLVQQVTMGRVHFDHLETGGQRAFRRLDKGLDDVSDLAFVELLGLCVLRVKGDR